MKEFLKQSLVFSFTSLLIILAALPVQAQGIEIMPEVTSRIWQSNSAEFGSVCLNGKELVCFRSELGDSAGTAAAAAGEKADDLAIKLTDLLNDKSFDPGCLMPGKDGNLSVLKSSNNCVLSFDPSSCDGSALEVSFHMVNAIRNACGAPLLPAGLLKLAGAGGSQQLSVSTTIVKTSSGIASGAFSGTASWYGGRFHGRRTSDGSRYDQEQLTAAHRSLPFGTRLLVMNRKTGQSCVVRVNDRGPFVGNRVIDLSKGAARELHMLNSGVAIVDCLVLGPGGQVH